MHRFVRLGENAMVPVISFIVPALNEEKNLPPLIDRLLTIEGGSGYPCEILIVNDASVDSTYAVSSELAKQHTQVRVLHKDPPRGIGNSIRTALPQVRGRVAIVVMADGVDPLESAVPQFCHKVLGEGCQLVLLSRHATPSDSKSIPLSYKFFHWGFRLLTRYALGIEFRDTTYAFRAFDPNFVRSLPLNSRGFEISPEITFKTVFTGGKVGEVTGRQTRRVHGKSKFRFSKAFRGYSRVLLEAAWLRIKGKNPASVRPTIPSF